MTISAYLRMLRRHWVVMLVATLLGVGASYGATLLMPTWYAATTTQFVRGIPDPNSGNEYQVAQFAAARAKSYSSMIGNPDVLSGVVGALRLDMTPAELYSQLSAENPVDTTLITVTARAHTPEDAQAISNAAADNLAKLVVRLESNGTSTNKSPIDVQTVVPAQLPSAPTSPRLYLNLALGAMAGASIGCLIALGLDARAQRRAGRREVELTESVLVRPSAQRVHAGSGV